MPTKKEAAPARAAQNNNHSNSNGSHLIATPRGVNEELEELSLPTPSTNGGNSSCDVDVLYHSGSGEYWVPNPVGDGYHSLKVEALRRHLVIHHGLSDDVPKEKVASEVDFVIHDAEQNQRVDLVGNYSGYHKVGVYTVMGTCKLLIPVRTPVITPKEGNWDDLKGFLEGLIPNPVEVQVFRAWIQTSWLNFQKEPGCWGPGQVLTLLGSVGTGKTALQKNIITPIFGRECDPTSYMTGESIFSGHIAEAEHWRISDPKWTSRKEKENFANAFKTAVSESTLSVRPMYQQEKQMEIFKRVTISMNDEEEVWSVFPLMPHSTLEKILFLTTADQPTKFSPTAANWSEWSTTITEQLPAFLWDTIHIFTIPDELKDVRYGIQYRNPKIDSKTSAPTTQERAAEQEDIIYDAVFPVGSPDSREISSTQLVSLCHDIKFSLREAAASLIPKSPPHAGRLLQQLSKRTCRRFTVDNISNEHRSRFQMTKKRAEKGGPR